MNAPSSSKTLQQKQRNYYRPIGRVVTHLFLEWEVWGLNLGAGQSDTVLQTACYRYIFSKRAVLPGRNDAEVGPANSSHASAKYNKYNERFDLPSL